VHHWLFKKRGKEESPDSDFFTLPLAQKEMTVLAHAIVATCELEQLDKADEALLGTISKSHLPLDRTAHRRERDLRRLHRLAIDATRIDRLDEKSV
jgi:hypothetical protein